MPSPKDHQNAKWQPLGHHTLAGWGLALLPCPSGSWTSQCRVSHKRNKIFPRRQEYLKRIDEVEILLIDTCPNLPRFLMTNQQKDCLRNICWLAICLSWFISNKDFCWIALSILTSPCDCCESHFEFLNFLSTTYREHDFQRQRFLRGWIATQVAEITLLLILCRKYHGKITIYQS